MRKTNLWKKVLPLTLAAAMAFSNFAGIVPNVGMSTVSAAAPEKADNAAPTDFTVDAAAVTDAGGDGIGDGTWTKTYNGSKQELAVAKKDAASSVQGDPTTEYYVDGVKTDPINAGTYDVWVVSTSDANDTSNKYVPVKLGTYTISQKTLSNDDATVVTPMNYDAAPVKMSKVASDLKFTDSKVISKDATVKVEWYDGPAAEWKTTDITKGGVYDARITITGDANITASAATFAGLIRVNEKRSLADATVTLGNLNGGGSGNDEYNDGAEIKYASIAVTYPNTSVNGGAALTPDTDYEVKYENNINAGTARVTLTALKDSKWLKEGTTWSKTFTIKKRDAEATDVKGPSIVAPLDKKDSLTLADMGIYADPEIDDTISITLLGYRYTDTTSTAVELKNLKAVDGTGTYDPAGVGATTFYPVVRVTGKNNIAAKEFTLTTGVTLAAGMKKITRIVLQNDSDPTWIYSGNDLKATIKGGTNIALIKEIIVSSSDKLTSTNDAAAINDDFDVTFEGDTTQAGKVKVVVTAKSNTKNKNYYGSEYAYVTIAKQDLAYDATAVLAGNHKYTAILEDVDGNQVTTLDYDGRDHYNEVKFEFGKNAAAEDIADQFAAKDLSYKLYVLAANKREFVEVKSAVAPGTYYIVPTVAETKNYNADIPTSYEITNPDTFASFEIESVETSDLFNLIRNNAEDRNFVYDEGAAPDILGRLMVNIGVTNDDGNIVWQPIENDILSAAQSKEVVDNIKLYDSFLEEVKDGDFVPGNYTMVTKMTPNGNVGGSGEEAVEITIPFVITTKDVRVYEDVELVYNEDGSIDLASLKEHLDIEDLTWEIQDPTTGTKVADEDVVMGEIYSLNVSTVAGDSATYYSESTSLFVAGSYEDVEIIGEYTVSRLYAGGDHFYTANAKEAKGCGYAIESTDYFKVSAMKDYSVDVYRLYSPASNDHFYTTNKKEADAATKIGYNLEGVAFKAHDGFGTPVHRMYNAGSGDHFYTKSFSEAMVAGKAGYNYEGVAFYVD